ncbi:hypothetical protein ACT691_19870 [Vibrio metschnikovii]
MAKLAQLTQWSIEQFDDQIILLSSLAVVLCVVLCFSPIGKKHSVMVSQSFLLRRG